MIRRRANCIVVRGDVTRSLYLGRTVAIVKGRSIWVGVYVPKWDRHEFHIHESKTLRGAVLATLWTRARCRAERLQWEIDLMRQGGRLR